jgi:hypothetical protein
MALTNRYFHGKRVSRSHYRLLLEAEHRGIVHFINQGRRTIAEQTAFWLHYLRFGSPLAARPWGGAPHIKWGAENHALDINAPQPAHSVASFYRSQGVPVSFDVPSEAWHMDPTDNAALKRAAKRFAWRDQPLIKPGAKGPKVLRLKRIMWAHNLRDFNRLAPVHGKGSVAAIKRLQKRHHLKQDGVVGPATWRILL